MCCGLPSQANPPFISPLYVATILRQVASGMMALHSRGYLHRDLNPNNVLVYSLDANCITVKGASMTTCFDLLYLTSPIAVLSPPSYPLHRKLHIDIVLFVTVVRPVADFGLSREQEGGMLATMTSTYLHLRFMFIVFCVSAFPFSFA